MHIVWISGHFRHRNSPVSPVGAHRSARAAGTNARPEGAQGLAVDQVTEAVDALDTSKKKSSNQYVSGVYRSGTDRGHPARTRVQGAAGDRAPAQARRGAGARVETPGTVHRNDESQLASQKSPFTPIR